MLDNMAGSGGDLEKLIPSFEEGRLRPSRKMSRYLSQGAAGRSDHACKKRLTSPAAPIS